MTNPKDFDLDSIRRRFAGLFSALGGPRALAAEPAVAYTYASAANSTPCPFMIRPSSHERVAIEAHRGDWL